MKTIIFLTTFIISILLAISCSKEDDIDQVHTYEYKHVRFVHNLKDMGKIVYAEYVANKDVNTDTVVGIKINDAMSGISYKDTSGFFISEYEIITLRLKFDDGKTYLSMGNKIESDSITISIDYVLINN